jgi:hypothetical protein
MNVIKNLKEIGNYTLYFIPPIGFYKSYEDSKKASKLAKAFMLSHSIHLNLPMSDYSNTTPNILGYDKAALATELGRIFALCQWYAWKDAPSPFNTIFGGVFGALAILGVPLYQIMISRNSKKSLSKYESNTEIPIPEKKN